MAPDWLYTSYGRDDAAKFAALAEELAAQGDMHAAASAYDRAYGLNPTDSRIADARWKTLTHLSYAEHGILFRYIPAGTFLMGSEAGDPDESPVHPVQLDAFWIAETPLSWAKQCELLGWDSPDSEALGQQEFPESFKDEAEENRYWSRVAGNKDRLQYCEDETLQACDWHAHIPEMIWNEGTTRQKTSRDLFGEVPRAHPERPYGYDKKPVIAVDWETAEYFCEHISTPQAVYCLPTEAQWEKAARGGLIDADYPWGNEPASPSRCDFDRFEQFSIQQMRTFPPNGYGLYAMSGCVWEWTADWYDADYYKESPHLNPTGPNEGKERVLRGGSWADCADALCVSFRMSRKSCCSPTVGLRLCRAPDNAEN